MRKALVLALVALIVVGIVVIVKTSGNNHPGDRKPDSSTKDDLNSPTKVADNGITPVKIDEAKPPKPDLSSHFTVKISNDAPVNSFLSNPNMSQAIIDHQADEQFYIPLFYAHNKLDLDAIVSRKTEILSILKDSRVSTRTKQGVARLCKSAAAENGQAFTVQEYITILGVIYNAERKYDYAQAIASIRDVLGMTAPADDKSYSGLKARGWDLLEEDYAYASKSSAP